jgi:hypothetical protein
MIVNQTVIQITALGSIAGVDSRYRNKCYGRSNTMKIMTNEEMQPLTAAELDAVAGAGGYADASGGYEGGGGGGGFNVFDFGFALYNSTIGALGRMLG